MPTLLQHYEAARVAAEVARDAAEAAVTAGLQSNTAAQAALEAAVGLLGTENEAGAALRAALDDAPNPADAAALVTAWEAHVIAARQKGAAVLDAQIALAAARSGSARATAAAEAARAALSAAAARAEAAAVDDARWTAWKAAAMAGAGDALAGRAAALIAGAYAAAKVKVDEDVPAALQVIAADREAAALAALDGAGGLVEDRDDAVDALVVHLDTGGLADAAAARALQLERAAALLEIFGPGAEPSIKADEATLAVISARTPLSQAVLDDIAAKVPALLPADPGYADELDAWEAAVPDAAWVRLRQLRAARRRLDRFAAATHGSAEDPAAIVAAFDAAEDAYATALAAADAFAAATRQLEAVHAVAADELGAHDAARPALLLAASRGDR